MWRTLSGSNLMMMRWAFCTTSRSKKKQLQRVKRFRNTLSTMTSTTIFMTFQVIRTWKTQTMRMMKIRTRVLRVKTN